MRGVLRKIQSCDPSLELSQQEREKNIEDPVNFKNVSFQVTMLPKQVL